VGNGCTKNQSVNSEIYLDSEKLMMYKRGGNFMKHMRKILSIILLLAIVQGIHFSNPSQVSGELIDPSYLLIDPQFIILNPDPIISVLLINTYNPTLFTPVILGAISGGGTFSFGEGDVTLGGTVAPRPGPRGDDPELIGALTAANFTNAIGLAALGLTSPPRPGPHGDDLDWASNAVFVDGIWDLAGLSINVDQYGFLQPGDALALFGATGGFINFPSVKLVGANAGSFMVLDAGAPDALWLARVPEPSTMILLGVGLFGLAGVGIRRRKKTAAK
jgi:PEP-CTERM motif